MDIIINNTETIAVIKKKIDLKQREIKLIEIKKTASNKGLALLDKMVEKFESNSKTLF